MTNGQSCCFCCLQSTKKANCASDGECIFIITLLPFECIVCGNYEVEEGKQCDGEYGCKFDCTKGSCYGKEAGDLCLIEYSYGC